MDTVMTFYFIMCILYVALFIAFALAMKEIHFIKKHKKCRHICFLCKYAKQCHREE